MNKRRLPVVEPVETTFKLISICLLSLFLISCKSTEAGKSSSKKITADGLRPIYITNSKKVNLLLPEYAGQIFEGLQLLNGSFGDKSFNLLSYTQIDARGISLSLMNDFGTDMGNLFYDGEKVIFDSAFFPKSLPGEYILCDIQNAFYDAATLEENYKNAGLNFEYLLPTWAKGTSEEARFIYDGKKLIEEISIKDNTVTIKNYLRGYEYQLTKLEE